MKVLDLCAGTGSATQAFHDRGHEVDTLDIVGDQTYICDVREFIPTTKYDFVWASPPCPEFSLLKRIPCRDRHPDMSIVYACIRICSMSSSWILENPRACLRYFIGCPAKTINFGDFGSPTMKPTDLWGTFPDFSPDGVKHEYIPWHLAHENGKRSERAARRAMIPYDLSLAICQAVEREKRGVRNSTLFYIYSNQFKRRTFLGT